MSLRRLPLITLYSAVGIIGIVAAGLSIVRATRIAAPVVTEGTFSLPNGPVHFHSEFYGNDYELDGTRPNRIASAQSYFDVSERWRLATTVEELETLCTPEEISHERDHPYFAKILEQKKTRKFDPNAFSIFVFLTVETDSQDGKRLYVAFSYKKQSWDAAQCNVHVLRLEPGGAKLDGRGEIDAINRDLQRGAWKQFGAPRDLNWF